MQKQTEKATIMKYEEKKAARFAWLVRTLAVTVLLLTTVTVLPAAAQVERPTEVALDLISTEIRTLPKPIQLNPTDTKSKRFQALIFTVEVEIEALNALAPSLQPVLYVGDQLVPLYGAKPGRSNETMQLEAYAFEWNELEEGAPVVLTVDIGVTQRQPERFKNSRKPRFSWRDVYDKR